MDRGRHGSDQIWRQYGEGQVARCSEEFHGAAGLLHRRPLIVKHGLRVAEGRCLQGTACVAQRLGQPQNSPDPIGLTENRRLCRGILMLHVVGKEGGE